MLLANTTNSIVRIGTFCDLFKRLGESKVML